MSFEMPAGDGVVGEAPVALIDTALARYRLRRLGTPKPVAESVLNPNYRVETDRGTRFVRLFKERSTPEIIEAEHRLMAWVSERGIPVCLPEHSLDGHSYVEAGEQLLAVFPWVAGTHFRRETLTPAQSAVLGEMQGRVQSLLRGYSDPVLEARPRSEVEWDTDATIAALSRVDDVIRYYPAPSADRLEAQAWLRTQLDLLEAPAIARPHSDFDGLPQQIDHCDFHERNAIIGPDGLVAAVIDWERARVNPRAFHLFRALDFTGAILRPETLAAYARGFGQHVRLGREEVSIALEQWWQSNLHQAWVFTGVFIRGDDGLRRFMGQIEPRLRTLADEGYRRSVAETVSREVAG